MMPENRVPVEDRAQLSAPVKDKLFAELARHTSLERVLDWARAFTPPRALLEIVTQDEYTHDVVIPFDEGLFLVYDTT